MKLKCTHFLYLLLISIVSYSQPQANKSNTTVPKKTSGTSTQVKTNSGNNSSNPAANATAVAYSSPLTGVWRGFFTSGMGFFQEKYRYEVQIGQLNNNGIKGVTYSYKTTVFYGKANLAGMYTPSTKNLVLKENKLVEVKMSSGDNACLMTCYLEYSKVGEVEILEGTFTSVNITTRADCGSGRVYLEKVPESDFYKEDFIRDYEARKKNPPVNSTPPKVVRQTPKTQPKTKPKTTTTATDQKKPVKKDDAVKKDPSRTNIPGTPQKIDDNIVVKPLENKVTPKELKERENKVAKLIEAEGDEITVELYDNGQIDNDTITVYHNKRAVIVRKRLCHQPITIRIKVDPDHPRNEFVMVAENLGAIPPNTALMIITVGKQRYEVTLTSTEQKNAMVIVECKPPSREGK